MDISGVVHGSLITSNNIWIFSYLLCYKIYVLGSTCLGMPMFQVIRIYKDKEHVELEFTVSQLCAVWFLIEG